MEYNEYVGGERPGNSGLDGTRKRKGDLEFLDLVVPKNPRTSSQGERLQARRDLETDPNNGTIWFGLGPEARQYRLKRGQLCLPKARMRKTTPGKKSSSGSASCNATIPSVEQDAMHTSHQLNSRPAQALPRSAETARQHVSHGLVSKEPATGVAQARPSSLVGAWGDGNTTRLFAQDNHHHMPHHTTCLIDKPALWVSASNESKLDPAASRAANAFSSERSLPPDDAASVTSGTTSSRASTALSDMSSFRCHKCDSNHSPDFNPLIKCPSCRRQFHGRCHKPPIPAEPKVRQLWQCNYCVKHHRPCPAPSRADMSAPAASKVMDTQTRNLVSAERRDRRFQDPSRQASDLIGAGQTSTPSNSLETHKREHSLAHSPHGADGKFIETNPPPHQDLATLIRSYDTAQIAQDRKGYATDLDDDIESHLQNTVHRKSPALASSDDDQVLRDLGAEATSIASTRLTSLQSEPSEAVADEADAAHARERRDSVDQDKGNYSDDFVYDDSTKPPFTYPDLIGMALCRAPGCRLAAAQVVVWISRHFPFYRTHGKTDGWKRSISVHLSTNDAFQKQAAVAECGEKACSWSLEEGMRERYLLLLAEARQKGFPSTQGISVRSNPLGQSHHEKNTKNTTHQYDILYSGCPHYKIVCRQASGMAWEDLPLLESAPVHNLEYRIGDLVEYPCRPWHREQGPHESLQTSVGQVLDIKMSQDDEPYVHVLWLYRRTELKTIQCKNFKRWPPQCRFLRSTHMEVLPASELSGLADISIVHRKTQDLVLDFGVAGGKGAVIRSSTHPSVSWLENLLDSSRHGEHHTRAPKGQRVSAALPKVPLVTQKTPSAKRSLRSRSTTGSSLTSLLADDNNRVYSQAINPQNGEFGSKTKVTQGNTDIHVLEDVHVYGRESMSDELRTSYMIQKQLTPSGCADSKARAIQEGSTEASGDNQSEEATIVEDRLIHDGNSVLAKDYRCGTAWNKTTRKYATPNAKVVGFSIGEGFQNQGKFRKSFNEDHYNPARGRDFVTRLFRPQPKASGRYFKKRRLGRDDSFRLWQIDKFSTDATSESTPAATSQPSSGPLPPSLAKLASSHGSDTKDQENVGKMACSSMEELLGIRGTGDYEMIIHEGVLAFREKVMA
ncbi:MAG: hypothetical protein M1822_001453 [Bathelium mastoideum]|nr:MAG: hypothetical protein M1822_001453 [Bathelium mastoideum]